MIIGAGIASGLLVLAGWWLFSDKKQQQPEVQAVMPDKSFSQQKVEPADGSDIPLEPEKPSTDIVVSG